MAHSNIKKIKFSLIYPIFMSVATSTFALTADKNLPVQLSANSAICKQQKETSICTYTGDAKFDQGTTHLHAQKITLYKIRDKISKITAEGKHSHYSTIFKDNKQPVVADGNLIIIYLEKGVLVVSGNGEIVVGKDKYSGPYVEYKFK